MYKKIVCLMLSLVFLTLSVAQVKATDESSLIKLNDLTSLYKLSDGEQYSVLDLTNIQKEVKIDDLDFDDLDFLVLNESQISKINSFASDILDKDTTIFIKYPSMTNEEIARHLELSKTNKSTVNPYQRVGVAIYLFEGALMFHTIYYHNIKNNTDVDVNILIEDSLNAVVSSYNECRTAITESEPSETYEVLEESLPVIDQESLIVYEGSRKICKIVITQTQYPKGYAIVNGKNQIIWNTKGFVSLNPYENVSIVYYDIRMHCNITNHKLLDYSELENTQHSTNYSVTVGESPSFSSSWSFNPYGQTYDCKMGANYQIRDWEVYCNTPIREKSRQSAPGISCTTSGGAGQRGSFTRVMVWGVPFEVGSWW